MNENHSTLVDSTTLRAGNMVPNTISSKAVVSTTTPTPTSGVHADKENIFGHETAIQTTSKRKGYLSWDDYFLAVAFLSSKRSKDPKSPSGACIVDQKNRIVGIGYSGFPRGCSDSVFPWNDDQGNDWLHSKAPYICQSVSNAILNKCTSDVAGGRIYVMEYPNSESAKVIIQSGIQEVVVLGMVDMVNFNDMEIQAGQILLNMAKVHVRFSQPDPSILCLDFVSKIMTPATEIPDSWTDDDKVALQELEHKESEKQRVAREALLEEANYDASKVNDNGKSNDFISWEDYFMAMAFLTAQRSKDPNTQVGACIVDEENRIIGLGYNGFPSGCSDDLLPWARSNSNGLNNKYLYVCHAEVNAILNKGSANVKGATIYVALFPCQNCAKMIIQSGIKEVVFMSDAYHDTPGCRASRIMFRCASVKLRQYIPSMKQLVLDLGNAR